MIFPDVNKGDLVGALIVTALIILVYIAGSYQVGQQIVKFLFQQFS